MSKLRLRFCKTGRAKFISHLDLMATLRRAFTRAGVVLKYSQGFNPHPYMSAALPLSVGCESVCELLDFEPASDIELCGLPERINAFLPEGLIVTEAYVPQSKLNSIAWLELFGALIYDSDAPDTSRFYECFTRGCIVITKKTKRGMTEIDIAPYVKDIVFAQTDRITVTAKVSAQNPTLSGDSILSAFSGEYGDLLPDFAAFKRIEVYDNQMARFR